jgi:CRISPR-associated protein Cmr3
MGESSVATHGDITPMPFAGAIRSKILSNKIKGEIPDDWYTKAEFKELVDIIGTPEKEGKIRFFGTYYYKHDEIFPTPYDIVKDDDKLSIARPSSFNIGGYRAVLPGFKEEGGYITLNGLKKYLHGDVPNKDEILNENDMYESEERVGIGIDRYKKIAKEKMLYSIEYMRLKEDYSFSMLVNDIYGLPSKGMLKLGGEGRGAYYEIQNKEGFNFDIIKKVNQKGRFKLYLSTPAIFMKDGKNYCMPDDKKISELLGAKVRLVSMLPGKYMRLGGWDLLRGKQKPLRYAVRGGAIYYYEIIAGKLSEEVEMPIMVSDVDAWLGLGSAFIGGW